MGLSVRPSMPFCGGIAGAMKPLSAGRSRCISRVTVICLRGEFAVNWAKSQRGYCINIIENTLIAFVRLIEQLRSCKCLFIESTYRLMRTCVSLDGLSNDISGSFSPKPTQHSLRSDVLQRVLRKSLRACFSLRRRYRDASYFAYDQLATNSFAAHLSTEELDSIGDELVRL